MTQKQVRAPMKIQWIRCVTVCTMEHNLETLRTRLTQVADLRDAQGIRQDHRDIIARLNEVEIHTLREFMSKILRLESMLSGENGGAIGEAIRACNRRIDNHRDMMEDFYARISIQDWYHDISDQEGGEEVENQPGMENRPSGRRRLRGHAPQRRIQRPWQRPAPRPPPPPLPVNDATAVRDTERTATVPPEMMQQAMQRLFAAYHQCVARVSQTDERLEQFRSNIRRDALEMSLTMQRSGQDIQHQQHAIEQIKSALFEDVQDRVKSLEERLRSVMDHEMHVHQPIDRNIHSQCASIKALISEQEDVRKLVEELANRLDRSQEASSAAQSEVSTDVLLEISDLRSKVLHLTEQNTKLEGDLSFLTKMSEQLDLLEDQVIKWRYRLPELTDDESQERVVSAVEVREELDEFKEVVLKKLKEFLTNLNSLHEKVRLIENDREESWEAICHKVSTMVEDSVGSLTERLTELEHTVQSHRITHLSRMMMFFTERHGQPWNR